MLGFYAFEELGFLMEKEPASNFEVEQTKRISIFAYNHHVISWSC